MSEQTETLALALSDKEGEVLPFGWLGEVKADLIRTVKAEKEKVLSVSRKVLAVTNDDQLALATKALRGLKDYRKAIDSSHSAIKAPVLALSRRIDSVKAEALAETDKEENRIKGHANHYQLKQREAAEAVEAEKKRQQAEADRLRIQEEQRLADIQRKLEEAKTAKAKAELGKQLEQSKTALLDAELLQEEVALTKPVEIVQPKGMSVQDKLNFQITDPIVFVQAYPEFWKWNEETETLKLMRRELVEELNKVPTNRFLSTPHPEELPAFGGIPRPPGLRVYREVKTQVR